MNALNEDVKVQAHGNWFTFKPQEIKPFHNDKLAEFLRQHRAEDGLVQVDQSLMEMDKNTEEYKTIMFELRKQGIAKYVAKQNYIIRNLEISLRRDYETSGQKGNYNFEASKGELQAYKNLKKYKEFETEQKLNTADEIQKIRNELYGTKETVSPIKAADEE